MEQLLQPKAQLYVVQIMALFGLGVVARARMARDPKIGRPFLVTLDSGGLKPVLFALQAGLLIVALAMDGFPALFTVLAVYGMGMLTWLSPGAYDRACGEEGVFSGWYGGRYEELEAWVMREGRLAFRLFGRWSEVEVPSAKEARVRTILQRVAPERELGAEPE